MTLWPLAIAAAASLPLITVAVVPPRWLKPSIALVLVSPVILYFGIIVWEVLTRPPEANALGLAFSGFMLVSAFLTIPWLVICLVGFGIGWVIRRLLRGGRDRTAPVPRTSAAEATATQPVSGPASETATDMARWRSVHIGFSHDGLTIGDVDVWKHEWRAVTGSLLRLAHLAYPRQIHTYRIFDAGDEGQSIRFAASELSNGVWGFYVAVSDTVAPQHLSADGSLLYEHRVGEGRSQAPSGAVLREADTGRILVDCAAWPSSEIEPNADGSLFLQLGRNNLEVVFRIAPAARSFRNHSEGGSDHPLSSLAEAVEEARAAIEASPLRSARPKPLAAWRIGLLILIGTVIAVAVASHRVAGYSPIPAQELTPMPKMPDLPSPRPSFQPQTR